MSQPFEARRDSVASAYLGHDFSARVLHGLLVTVTPSGWRVAHRGRALASGPEKGARGFACAMAVVDGGMRP